MRIAISLVLILLHVSAFAADYKPLMGEYTKGGKTFYDPPEEESKDTHIYFVLTGATAKDLFNSMKVPAMRDVCMNDGSLTKLVKEMQCTQSLGGKQYRCWFGIDIKNQHITGGVVC
jgi:hypothetical protein